MSREIIMKLIFFLIIQFTSTILIYGQDIGDLGSQKPFTITGGIGGNTTFYSSNEPFSTRDPFSWNIHGNFVPTIYGFSLPFSFSVSQYSESYADPFTQFGISPSYKWIKLRLGYRNIPFSPFVFDGQNFLGAGVELNPGSFYIASFYGKTNKAISMDTTQIRNIEPQYARNAYGVKLGLREQNKELTLMYMRAEDQMSSINNTIQTDSISTLSPEANSILGLTWSLPISKKLIWQGDIATSLWTRDISRSEEHTSELQSRG